MQSAVRNSVDQTIISRIACLFGLDAIEYLPVQSGYRNHSCAIKLRDGRHVNLIIYKSEAGMLQTIRHANRISNYVAALGMPARQTLDQRIVRLSLKGRVAYAALYSYLPGDTIAWEAYTMKHLKLLGMSMSNMHASLLTLKAEDLPRITTVFENIVCRMQCYYATPSVQNALEKKLGLKPPDLTGYKVLLRASSQLPGNQVLHMDFVRGNILFKNTDEVDISGILDFEKAAHGHPVYDIARTLAFLLVDCKYKTADKVYKYFLQSGYIKYGRASYRNISVKMPDGTSNLLGELVDMFLLYDFYKFLVHNPYENLSANEHYSRTRNLLIEKNRLVPSTIR